MPDTIRNTADLRILYEHSMMQQLETLDWRDDGMLVGQNSRYMLMVMDPLTGAGKQLYPVAHTGNDVSIRQYYGPGYDVYMTRAEGIFGVMQTERNCAGWSVPSTGRTMPISCGWCSYPENLQKSPKNF